MSHVPCSQIFMHYCKNILDICLRSTTHGVFTDSHWKCSDEEEAGWNTERFDDRSWDAGHPVGSNYWFYSFPDYGDFFLSTSKMIRLTYANSALYCRARLCYGLLFTCKIMKQIEKLCQMK